MPGNSRRAFLKTTGTVLGTGILSSTISGASAAKRNGTTPIVITGSRDDPVTREHIEDAVAKANSPSLKTQSSDDPSGKVVSLPDFEGSDSRYVKSFVYKSTKNGKPMSHIEYGFDVDAPQRRGRDAGTSQASTQSSSEPTSAQEVADAFDRASTIQEYESLTSSVTTQSPNLMTGEEWEKYNLVSAVGGQDSNFGELSITGNLYRYDPNEENVDANLYGSIHQYKAEHEYCGGCWLSHSLDRARLVQDWGVASSDTGNGGLGVYEPNEDREKTKDQVTYGLSVGGSFSSKDGFEVNAEGSIQWTYDIPKVPLQARSYDDAAIWEYDTSKYEAGDDFIVSTGSTCWFDPSDVDPDSPQVGQANMGAEFSSSVKTQYLGAILEYSEEY